MSTVAMPIDALRVECTIANREANKRALTCMPYSAFWFFALPIARYPKSRYVYA